MKWASWKMNLTMLSDFSGKRLNLQNYNTSFGMLTLEVSALKAGLTLWAFWMLVYITLWIFWRPYNISLWNVDLKGKFRIVWLTFMLPSICQAICPYEKFSLELPLRLLSQVDVTPSSAMEFISFWYVNENFRIGSIYLVRWKLAPILTCRSPHLGSVLMYFFFQHRMSMVINLLKQFNEILKFSPFSFFYYFL